MANPKTGTVFNTKSYTVDLDDGRILEPSGTAENVKLGNPHNAALIDAGTLEVRGETDSDDGEVEDRPAPKNRSERGGLGPLEV